MWIYLELRTQRRHQWTVSGWRRVCCHSGPVRQFLWWLGSPVSLHWSRVQRLLTTHRKNKQALFKISFFVFFLSCMTNVTPFYEGTVQQAAQARLFLVCLYITDQVGGNVRRMFGRISWVISQSSCPKHCVVAPLMIVKSLKSWPMAVTPEAHLLWGNITWLIEWTCVNFTAKVESIYLSIYLPKITLI